MKSTTHSIPQRVCAVHLDTNRRFLPVGSGLWRLPIILVGDKGLQHLTHFELRLEGDPRHEAYWRKAGEACAKLREAGLWVWRDRDVPTALKQLVEPLR